MQIPRRKSEELRRHDDGPTHITKEGLERLEEHLAELKRKLPEYIEETERTASYGDRSENAEYKDAKATLRRTHRQILSIEEKIKRAIIILPGLNAKGTIQIGSTVVLEIDGARKTFQIVGSHETDPTHGRISYKSPLGAELMNHKKGDTVHIKTPTGTQQYTILEIR